MNLGDNIQYLRKINDITQEELAERLSVSRQTVSKWEMNQAYPEIQKLIEIGNIFHCKIDELLKENWVGFSIRISRTTKSFWIKTQMDLKKI